MCATTHAVIPAFSLPNTSIGTKEAEDYLFFTGHGLSRNTLAPAFFRQGQSRGYLRQIEKMLWRCIANAKALFPDSGDHTKKGLQFIYSVTGQTSRPLHDFNLFCLAHTFNPVFCSRSNIIQFKKNSVGSCISHNKKPP